MVAPRFQTRNSVRLLSREVRCFNPAMTDPAVRALVELLKREGGEVVVGTVIGANPKSLYQIAAGRLLKSGRQKGVGRDLRERLERHYPGWISLGAEQTPATGEERSPYRTTGQTITPSGAGQSQPMRLTYRNMAPTKVGWEALLKADLPSEFETSLPDNAMAPEAPKGTRCIFVTGHDPEPGDWVLLADRGGQVYCREYRVLSPGRWEAHAVNRAFLPMRGEDGLRVLAVFDGWRGRRSAR